MSDVESHALGHTVLHDWHVAHGARMVVFAGYDMPVQYPTGITREHAAVRLSAGVFDICHMGRFRIRGAGAAAFLGRVLTNDPAQLQSGQAHYTLLADANGAAVDDAYLYRLAHADFLLVVNAANRAKDWGWIEAQGVPDTVAMGDESAERAMIALQGPRAGAQLEALLGASAMPEARRNRLSVTSFAGAELIVARTGYTGEREGFELFVESALALDMWQALVDLGAVPAGLGARDSLRLEAGLPLYGHEFGVDADGVEIPIFANALARFGVRRPGHGTYVGCVALDAQRAEYDAIAAGTLATPVSERRLRRLVKPIAAFEARRPLRAGYVLHLDGAPVGYVTSGTSVPIVEAGDTTQTAYPMRPIGLALVRSDLAYRADRVMELDALDGRGGRIVCRLVERNLPAARH